MSNCSAKLIQGLNRTLPWDPQELNLLGSMRIGNMTKNWTQTCFVFAGPAIARPNHCHFFNSQGGQMSLQLLLIMTIRATLELSPSVAPMTRTKEAPKVWAPTGWKVVFPCGIMLRLKPCLLTCF